MKTKWSLPMRMYHWLNSLIILLLLITVVLRKTVLDKYLISVKIQEFLKGLNIQIDKEETIRLAKTIRSEMWEWHYVFGFTLSVFIIIRIIMFFTKSGKQVVIDAFSFLKPVKKDNYWVKLLYLAVYLSILIISVTGVLMYFYKDLGWQHETKEMLESIHVAVMNIIIYFIPAHIIGVVLAESEDEKGIVSDMINGGEEDN